MKANHVVRIKLIGLIYGKDLIKQNARSRDNHQETGTWKVESNDLRIEIDYGNHQEKYDQNNNVN